MEKENKSDVIPIGKEIKILQELLDITQDDMAKMVFISRATLIKLEKVKNIEEITDNILFKLYYATERFNENQNIPEYARKKALELNNIIKDFLIQKNYKITIKKK